MSMAKASSASVREPERPGTDVRLARIAAAAPCEGFHGGPTARAYCAIGVVCFAVGRPWSQENAGSAGA